jgi:hypothetical protein
LRWDTDFVDEDGLSQIMNDKPFTIYFQASSPARDVALYFFV